MAIIRFGGGVSEARGSIAGNTFSRTRAGAIIRNRITPVNPNTAAQSGRRAAFQNVTDGFKELSKQAVDDWNAAAQNVSRLNALGETYTPSGKQLFMQAYLNRILQDPAVDIVATASDTLNAIVSNNNLPAMPTFEVDLVNTADVLTAITLDPIGAIDENATHFIVEATPQLLPSITNARRYFRHIGVFGVADPVDIEAAYTAVYPGSVNAPTVGNAIHVRARAMNNTTGMAGEWVYTFEVIPAAV